MKVGDRVAMISSPNAENMRFVGHIGEVEQIYQSHDGLCAKVSGLPRGFLCSRFKSISPSKGSNMLQDLRAYVKDNRQLLYTIALVVALDHFLFNGAFRERIKGVVDGFLKKAEDAVK